MTEEHVQQEETEQVAESQPEPEVDDRLLRLAADQDLCAQLGRSGREVALTRTWPEAIAELGRLYRGVLRIDHEAVRDAA